MAVGDVGPTIPPLDAVFVRPSRTGWLSRQRTGQHLMTVIVFSVAASAGLERSARVSENCNVLDHIPAATEDHPPSTVFLLTLVILVHRHFNFIDFVNSAWNSFYRSLSVTQMSPF